ncbi:MAG: DEAD/DEAH box helicase [bacterium]
MANKFRVEESFIISIFGINDYLKSKNIKETNINVGSRREDYDYLSCRYSIQDANDTHSVSFAIYRNSITEMRCSCKNFMKNKKCEHLAAAFSDAFEIVNKNDSLSLDDIGTNIVKKLVDQKEKELAELELSFEVEHNKLYIRIKVGSNKKYSINSKLKNFFNAYEYSGEVKLGKFFEYDNKNITFSKQDTNILEHLNNIVKRSEYKPESLYISKKELEYLLKVMGTKLYNIEGYDNNFRGYKNQLPCKVHLNEEEGKYNFKFDYNEINFINDEKSLAVINEELYFVPEEYIDFINELEKNGIKEIKLDKDTAVELSSKLAPTLKENLIIEKKLEDDFKIIKPSVKLYFDFSISIIAKVIFVYKGKDINYFDKKEGYRNKEFEENIIEDLRNLGFQKKGNNITLDDTNKIIDFIEKNIYLLKEKYEIYTTEKYNNASIMDTRNIKSQFNIGKDNILTYKFELGDINKDELKKIFASMNENIKYFKLKSGKILNTEDENIKELKNICDNLNIEEYSEEGTIPKYRALYLDSIKNYNIVDTNNLFEEFIENFNKHKNSEISLNITETNLLRDYQLTGTKWLYNIYKCGFGGILADEMGLGKSIQTIMFIKNVLKDKPDSKILIVAPTSLIYNWQNEFDMFGKELNYSVMNMSRKNREKYLETENDNIIITTYGLIRQDVDLYKKINFETIIVDEAQNIKNPAAGISQALKELDSNSRIALTGTPIENSVVEIWSIFDFLMPGYLNTLSNFQSKYNIKNMGEDAREILGDLNKLIKPFILRRKKKDVLFDLPDKIENKIFLDLLPEQKKYYVAQVKKSKEEFNKLVEEEGFVQARFKILQLLIRLRQICIDPSIVFDNFEGESVKMVETINIIKQYIDNGHKILIFSTFKTSLNILREKLDENNISHYQIDGSVSSINRKKLVDSFNSDNTSVFLITLKAGGTGLNLTSADVVIHLDMWWNPQAENQATDRAHRIGQKNTVEVVKLICKGTIEERIMELQEKKKILNDSLIETGELDESAISKLDENDIKSLLQLSE